MWKSIKKFFGVGVTRNDWPFPTGTENVPNREDEYDELPLVKLDQEPIEKPKKKRKKRQFTKKPKPTGTDK